ncbi:transcriptional regulator [Thauera sp. SDU_THAU2]|uniref:transcriptional regulator n=1 Tax=Thauera sp. SDU_THAU2 TaxID=3136633 RepID=UPI00311EDDC8
MGKKETEEAIADSRAGRVAGRLGSVDELLADLKADDTPENLENWLHEKAGPAHDALKADPARAVSADRVRYTLDELLAESDYSQPLPAEEREWVDAPTVGRELLPEDLQTAEAIAAFLVHAEASGDLDYVEHAREVAARARAMHGIK